MANTYQQRAQQRKVIYAVLIMGLFTAALVHRNFVIYAQANQMQLRELTRGEVELTSSVMRHTLSGLHGLGVTILWSAAIEKQKKHEWNELELLINSITRLQPYFITPWRFQGWNLAFNVAVECDRPVDKYYYISRGLTLLAHGERRNQGTPEKGEIGFPGNPDLRRDIGFFYTLKMGTSDDKYTMRCLLDMSCVDPVERRFDLSGLDGDMPTPELKEKLGKFCKNNPTLARRIIEKLHERDKPRAFIEFLEDNRDLPSRFDIKKLGTVKQANFTPRKDPTEQFPILPQAEADWPNPEAEVLTNEAMSVYLIARTWYEYAKKPLPPPDNPYDRVVEPSKREFKMFDTTKYRTSRLPEIFVRSDPCRAQASIAETMQEEGWFDGEGWSPPAAFGAKKIGEGLERYKTGPRWSRAYTMYLAYGRGNGMYLSDKEKANLEVLAKKFRDRYPVADEQEMQFLKRDVLESTEFYAHLAMRAYVQRRQMTNYDAHLYTAEAEMTDRAVTARKLYHQALAVRDQSPATFFRLVEQANYIWMDVLLEHPQFAQVLNTGENTYEIQLRYMAASQREPEIAPYYTDIILLNFELMPSNCWAGRVPWARVVPVVPEDPRNTVRNAVIQLGFELMPNSWAWARVVPVVPEEPRNTLKKHWLLSDGELSRLVPMRNSNKAIYTNIRGSFDMMQYYDSPRTPALKDALMLWSAGAGVPSNPLEFFPAALNPAHRMGLMTASPMGVYTPYPPPEGALPGEQWRYLIDQGAITSVRNRYNIK